MKQTFTVAEITKALSITKRSAERRAQHESWSFTEQAVRGGKQRIYKLVDLPPEVQAQLLRTLPADSTQPVLSEDAQRGYDAESLSAWSVRKSAKQRARGQERANLLQQVQRLRWSGQKFKDAAALVAKANDISVANLSNWYYGVNGRRGAKHYRMQDWAAALIPGYIGSLREAEISEEAWDAFKALFLVRSAPTSAICYERVARLATEHGWQWPSLKTIERKIKSDLPRTLVVLAREGAEGLDQLYPPVRRSREHFAAMQAVNGDGIQFRATIQWPDDEVAAIKVWIWQDLSSNKLLAWRGDKSENKNMLRLAYGDLLEKYGIPDIAFIDNTTAAASKWLTGGTKNRYRWKIRDEDPIGLMPLCGTRVQFVTPGRGQTKPIERANRELRERIDSHPKFEGRGTEARPIPYDEFMTVMEGEFLHYNARQDRDAQVAVGRSYDEAFAASYAVAKIRKATKEQRRLWLLCAERVRADMRTGSIVLGRGPQGENRYWCEALGQHMGESLVVRFDPHKLQQPVYVETLDGRLIGEAPCTWTGGFDDARVAQDFHREKNRFKRAAREALKAEKRMDTLTVANMLVPPQAPPTPESKVVELAIPKRAVGHDTELAEHNRNFDRLMRDLMEQKKAQIL